MLPRRKIAPRADEAHAGQDAKRQAHQVIGDERIWRLAAHPQQEIDLNHRGRGREAHQRRGAEPGRLSALASVEAEQHSGENG